MWYYFKEKFEDIKVVIQRRTWSKEKKYKRTNNGLQSITQKTKVWARCIPQKMEMNSGASYRRPDLRNEVNPLQTQCERGGRE
jgi:hypothetical protein